MSQAQHKTDVDRLAEVVRDYHEDELARLLEGYPEDKTNFKISYKAVEKRHSELAEEFLTDREELEGATELAVKQANTTHIDLGDEAESGDIDIQLVDLHADRLYTPGELRAEHANRYVGIEGTLGRVTSASDKPLELYYECARCGVRTRAVEKSDGWEEPPECDDCGRRGPFEPDPGMSIWTDFMKIRVDERLEDAAQMQGEAIMGELEGDLTAFGGHRTIAEHTGDDVIVYGEIKRRPKTGRNADTRTFDRWLDVQAIEYDDSVADINIAEHREAIDDFSNRDDAVELFARSIAPELYATEAMELAFKVGVAYLFAPPRIDPPNGPSYRGDIHAFLSGDPGQAKSMFMKRLSELSPKAIRGSATTSSEVGLTASAVPDEFGNGEWTLKPGMLVRANGGHAIIDEIDKGPDNLEKINDALEGEQQIQIEKAGMNATLKTRCGVMSAGNPEKGHFDKNETVSSQLDIDPTLLDRFDAIVVIKDMVDRERDENVAEHMGQSWQEAVAMDRGESDASDLTERPVPTDVARAWVADAKRQQPPKLSDEALALLSDHYVEVRELNGQNAEIPPATPRKMEFGIRFSMAFALARLSDTVEPQDVEHTIDVSKRLMELNWDTQTKQFDGYRNTSVEVKQHDTPSDEDEFEQLEPKILDAMSGEMTTSEIAGAVREEYERVGDALARMAEKGRIESKPNNRWSK